MQIQTGWVFPACLYSGKGRHITHRLLPVSFAFGKPAQSYLTMPRENSCVRADITENPASLLTTSSSLRCSTSLTHSFPDCTCLYGFLHSLLYSHLLNPPSGITFVFTPPVCLPSVSVSPRKHPKHRAPGREPQAGLVAAVGALAGICKLWRPAQGLVFQLREKQQGGQPRDGEKKFRE